MNSPSRPRLLDLYCKAGGASMGYHRAGFDVTGVDIEPQPRYPFTFHQGDALEFLTAHGHEFDAIAASPPCHDHSTLSALWGPKGSGWLLPATLEALAAQPVPWIVENVMGANMRADIVLCGSMFGLRTYRHRQFTIDPRIPLLPAVPWHPAHTVRASSKKRRVDFDAGMHITVTGHVGAWLGPACMGIDWMTGPELAQAIPPAYTHHLGLHLLDHLDNTTDLEAA
ncbi:DNA cytosine methyltransferase [Nocardia alba]|uniref:DNA (Cytosine-5)-methyltransferase 1 n=1 Tax=Nocardia alba TaxID=225051 RepID=A0A4R1FIF8_9NOCA|nr:DNA cytosine methyltransferase [Nocardia alba]TCJ94626.1 DNA (cytosine-5)-methyltransferase 1 [Nocardia alba]